MRNPTHSQRLDPHPSQVIDRGRPVAIEFDNRRLNAYEGDTVASALYVAGDLPFLKPADIYSMTQASRRQGNVTLAPARRDGGTNSMLVPHGVPLQPELGQGSFMKHLNQAARLQTSVAINSSHGLGFDLDVVDDLETFQHMEPGLLDRLSTEPKTGPT